MKKDIISNLKELKKVSVDATPKEAVDIIKDLEDTLNIRKGLGLSAIQIGIAKKVSIIRLRDIEIDLINPKIIHKSGKFKYKQETCLSFPGLKVDTIRYSYIKIINNNKEEEYTDLIAVVIQHELAHIKGRIILDDKWRKTFKK